MWGIILGIGLNIGVLSLFFYLLWWALKQYKNSLFIFDETEFVKSEEKKEVPK